MRVVLDTNVLARSAYRLEGLAAEVLDRLCVPSHLLILSTAILDELRRIFYYPRFREFHGMSDETIARFIDNLRQVALILDVPVEVVKIINDPDDAHVLAVAIAGRADVICTLDRHFHQAKVRNYCRRHMIEIMDDVKLLSRLRENDAISPQAHSQA
jgi:putative PIN family toxin of toxin-antitoxin system